MSVLGEWVEKAEADYNGAIDLRRRRRNPLPDLVCFHGQQCAEKYFKAYLLSSGAAIPRIHDLRQLLDLSEPFDSTLSSLRLAAVFLNQFSVSHRYPGRSASATDAQDAVQHMRQIRRLIRRKLGL